MSSTDRTAELWAALMKGEPEPSQDITSADMNRATRIKAEQTWGGRRLVEVRHEGEWRPLVLIEEGTKQPRRFWEYRESDGTSTNRRIIFLIVCALIYASLGAVMALIGGFSTWWPLIPAAAATAVFGASIAHAIDYVQDRKEGTK